MNLGLILYLADIASNMLNFFIVLNLFLGVGSLFVLFFYIECKNKDILKPFKYMAISFFLSLGLTVLLPSKETIYMIAAVNYTEEVLKQPKVLNLTDKVYRKTNACFKGRREMTCLTLSLLGWVIYDIYATVRDHKKANEWAKNLIREMQEVDDEKQNT